MALEASYTEARQNLASLLDRADRIDFLQARYHY